MPPRYEGDFACFDGWLPPPAPGRQGVPAAFSPAGFPAASSLARICQQETAQQQQQQQPAAQQAGPGGGLTLVGFSKGAVVLHQVRRLPAFSLSPGSGNDHVCKVRCIPQLAGAEPAILDSHAQLPCNNHLFTASLPPRCLPSWPNGNARRASSALCAHGRPARLPVPHHQQQRQKQSQQGQQQRQQQGQRQQPRSQAGRQRWRPYGSCTGWMRGPTAGAPPTPPAPPCSRRWRCAVSSTQCACTCTARHGSGTTLTGAGWGVRRRPWQQRRQQRAWPAGSRSILLGRHEPWSSTLLRCRPLIPERRVAWPVACKPWWRLCLISAHFAALDSHSLHHVLCRKAQVLLWEKSGRIQKQETHQNWVAAGGRAGGQGQGACASKRHSEAFLREDGWTCMGFKGCPGGGGGEKRGVSGRKNQIRWGRVRA